MQNSSDCPPDALMSKLTSWRASSIEESDFARHLENCSKCATHLDHQEAYLGFAKEIRRGVRLVQESGTGSVSLEHTWITPTSGLIETAIDDAHVQKAVDSITVDFFSDVPARIGAYEILGKLGEGGMGVVYLAEHVMLKQRVALKVMKPELASKPVHKSRFLREAQSTAAIKHHNIVQIYYAGEEDGTSFIAMEQLHGVSLGEWLKQYESCPIPIADTIHIGLQLATGLSAAHERNLIHRDIKPSNLWLEGIPDKDTQKMRLKLLDFGLARPMDASQSTNAGAIVGTPEYMSPEQASGKTVDHRSDLFSVGVVLYRLCTGRLPFAGGSIIEILSDLLLNNPPRPREVNPEVPEVLDELIARLLSKDPDGRPHSAAEVAKCLSEIEVTDAKNDVGPYSELSPSATNLDQLKAKSQRASWIAPSRAKLSLLCALAALISFAGYRFQHQIVNLMTNKGELIIESDDKDLEIQVLHNKAVVVDKLKGRQFELTAGEYEVILRDPADPTLSIQSEKVTISRAGKTVLKARFVPIQSPSVEYNSAKWLLEHDFQLWIDRPAPQMVTKVEQLPKDPFSVLHADARTVKKSFSDDDMVHLARLKNLKTLNLRYLKITSRGIKQIESLVNIESLNLQNTLVDKEGLAHLKHMTNLESLSLSNCVNLTGRDFAYLPPLPKLKSLSASNVNGINDDSLLHIQKFISLEELELNGAVMSYNDLERLLPLKNLVKLHLSNVRDRDLKYLLQLPKLKVLTVWSENLSDEGLRTIGKMLPLESIYLSSGRVTNPGISHLQTLRNLKSISLRLTEVTYECLVPLQSLPELVELDLSRTRLDDDGAKKVAVMFPNLEQINLGSTDVGDIGLEAFIKLNRIRKIIVSNKNISVITRDRFLKSHPYVNITGRVGEELK